MEILPATNSFNGLTIAHYQPYTQPDTMNAFYERLSHFAELVKETSQNERHNYAEHFKVQHPPYPVVSATRSVMPKLMFDENCPAELRHKIRRMLKRSFNRIRNKK